MDTLPHFPLFRRYGLLAAYLAVCALTAACGSSSTTITSPGSLSKCAVTLGAPSSTLPANGGTGSITVKTERECQWTAASEAGWLTVAAGASGQGEGTIQYNVGANGDPVQRTGAIVANGQRAEVTQAAGECKYELDDSSALFPNSGGSNTVQVRATSAMCAWTAASHADWIVIRAGREGRGNGAVSFEVAATTGPPRTGALTIAGQRYTVTQSEGCTFSIAPPAYAAPADGGASTIAVTAGPGCPWIAASNVDWIVVNQGAAATGNGTVRFTVSPSSGPTRTGTLNVAGEIFTVTQSAGCTYQVSPAAHDVDPAGGSRSVTVNAPTGCTWEAASNASWIALTGGQAGNGSGTVTFSVAATTGPSRSGTLNVAGQVVTVTQGQGCTYTIAPDNQTVPSSGGGGTVNVSTASGCGWNASSNADWIRITSERSGSGPGSVAYTVVATSGPSRSGTLTIAGRTFTVNQGQGCTYTITPESQTVPASGGGGTVNVAAADGCGWNASSNADWIRITSGERGTGGGSVAYTVASTNGPSRSGTLTIAGRTFTVNQGEGCTAAISPTSHTFDNGGGSVDIAITTDGACPWTASENIDWFRLSAASGTGSGTVQLTADVNTGGSSRTGTATIAGRTFTVTQGGCSAVFSPAEGTLPAAGGGASFAVDTGEACSWTATTSTPWIALGSNAPVTGDGTVQFTAEPNAGSARTGTIAVLGQTFTVRQDAGCTYQVSPDSATVPRTGGSVTVNVSTAGECTWTAGTVTDWIAVLSGTSGSGNGPVQLGVQPNAGPARSGTATVAGRTVTINQDSGCTFTIDPPSADFNKDGGSRTVTVTAAEGCGWRVTNTVPWIEVTAGATGSGTGAVQYTVAPNPDSSTRHGTLTIADQPFTVKQDGSE